MGKILIILLAFIVLMFAAFSFVLGALRRMFGISLRKRPSGSSQTTSGATRDPAAGAVLYHDSRTEVLRGESSPEKSNRYSNVRDASFVEGKTVPSPRPQK